ncbi:Dipeptidase 1 [Exophiala dermatitidis]
MRFARLVWATAALGSIASCSSSDFLAQAVRLMEESPLIDTHVDLPQVMRSLGRRPLDTISQLNGSFPGHVDIPRARQGRLGAAFWTVWAPCHYGEDSDQGPDFNTPTNHVRDALEILDLIQNMISQLPDDLQYARTSAEIWDAFRQGKIASLLGLEGTHVLGNSLSILRLYAQLGVRYLTLTHICHSSFASSAGMGSPLIPVHEGDGLSDLGRELIRELNRLGILVDLSHTSDNTMRQAIELSEAPVVWTHAGSRTVWNHSRNVPDEILELIGDGPGKKDGVVQSVFFPNFIGPYPGANVSDVANHIEHIASIIGRNRVGIASDFDGMATTVEGLEDVSKYPNLVAELLSRGWTEEEMRGVLGGNFMRIMDKADEVSERLRARKPSSAIWEKRGDLPSITWGGPGNQMYWPRDVKAAVDKMYPRHDEL